MVRPLQSERQARKLIIEKKNAAKLSVNLEPTVEFSYSVFKVASTKTHADAYDMFLNVLAYEPLGVAAVLDCRDIVDKTFSISVNHNVARLWLCLLLQYRDDITILNHMIHSDTLRAEPYACS